MNVGDKIRKIRQSKKLTLGELSKLTGITISGLSQIERGLNNPSLDTLTKITKALGVPIMSLFVEEKKSSEEVLTKRGKRSKVMFPEAEIVYEPLSPIINSNIEFLLAQIEEGKGQKSQVTHEGEECVYVIRGKLKVCIEDREYILGEGDSLYFKCSRPHNFMNAGEGKLILVLAVTPPSIYSRVVH